MKTFLYWLKKTGPVLMLALIILSSCVPMKKIRYLQDESKNFDSVPEYKVPESKKYVVHKGDNLYINVNSREDKKNFFDNPASNNNYYTESAIYLNSYTVNDSGFVEFPLIGKVMVDNMTVEEIQKALQLKVDEYIKNSVVIVKLANFRISMLGEFMHPGKYLVYQDKINMFEAIAMAGDMTTFAKKDHVLLLRETDNGVKKYRLKLNDNSIMKSEYYYLMPNDIVYVEPMVGKQFAFESFPYLLILSTITTTILLLDYFK